MVWCLQATPCIPPLDSWLGFSFALFCDSLHPTAPFPHLHSLYPALPPFPPLEPGSLPYHGEGEECGWRGLSKPYLPGLHWGPLCWDPSVPPRLTCPAPWLSCPQFCSAGTQLSWRPGGAGKGKVGGCLCLSLQTRNLTHLRTSSPPPSFPFTLLHWLTGGPACQPSLLCGLLCVQWSSGH